MTMMLEELTLSIIGIYLLVGASILSWVWKILRILFRRTPFEASVWKSARHQRELNGIGGYTLEKPFSVNTNGKSFDMTQVEVDNLMRKKVNKEQAITAIDGAVRNLRRKDNIICVRIREVDARMLHIKVEGCEVDDRWIILEQK